MRKSIGIVVFALMALLNTQGQCPELYDFFGAQSPSPYWYQCTGTDYTLNIQSPENIGAWTIDWGDGSPSESGVSLIPPASITHLYSAAVDTFIVSFTEISSGCLVSGVLVMEEATSASIQIPVGGLTQACAPQDMGFINSSTNTSETTVFVWDFGDGSPQETYDHSNWNQTITHTYQENTVDCETVVTLTAENQCSTIQGGNSTATFNPIRIWDYDDAAITPSDYVLCWPDNTVDYLNTSEMNCFTQGNIAQRYEYWNFGDHWGLGYDSIIDWTPWPPTFPYTISYPAIGSYSVMMLDSNFCGIDTAFVTINIVPPPTAGLTISDDTICQGEAVSLVNNSSPEANAWLIDFDNGSGWQAMGPTNVTFSYMLPGDYQIGLVAYVSGAGASCTDTTWVDLHVMPSPTASFSLSDYGECDSLSYSVTENSVSAVSWNWDMGNGNTYGIQNPPNQSYYELGSYVVTLDVTAANGCIDGANQLVNVYESPIASFTTTDLCLGETALFNDASTFNPADPIITWDWDFGDGDIASVQDTAHAYTLGGIYDVILLVTSANCSDDTIISVNVDIPPTASFTSDILEGCGPLTVSLTNSSLGATSYLWQYGDGNTSNDTSSVHTFINPTASDSSFTVYLTAYNAFGCSAIDSLDIIVFGTTTAGFTSNATPGCAPIEVDFVNQSQGAASYEWDFGDGAPVSNAVNPSHLFNNTSEFIQYYDVNLVAFDSNGCHDTVMLTVISYPEPDFSFDMTGASGCAPLTVDFPTISGAVSYNWDFGDGNSASGAGSIHVYQNIGTTALQYQVRLIASNPFGCTDTAYSGIDIYPTPFAQFTSDPMAGCSPLNVEFSNQSILADQSEWIFGSGDTLVSTDSIVTYGYSNFGLSPNSYNVTLNIESIDGCTSSSSESVSVYPQVSSSFTSITEGCSPLSISFINTSTGGTGYGWQFGDGGVSVSPNPTHIYVNNGLTTVTHTVRLITSNTYGCSDTSYVDIDVFPRPTAQFTTTPTAGCSPVTVEFENTSVLNDITEWVFGTGDTLYSSDSVIEYMYSNSGNGLATFDVELSIISSEGCTDEANESLSIYPEVHADFSSISVGCSPLEVQFTNNTTGASTYAWALGDGSFSIDENPLHTYVNNTAATQDNIVSLIATNTFGCKDTTSTNVKVYPKPVAQFTSTPSIGCSPLTVEFENTSFLADESIWIFGTGDTLATTDLNLEYVYTNVSTEVSSFTVELDITSADGCAAEISELITAYPEVHAGFNSISEGCSPLEVAFTNNTVGASGYSWSMGDGNFSIDENPIHTYVNPTAITQVNEVTLLASNTFGCTDTSRTTVTVFPRPIAQFIASPTSGCSPLSVQFQNISFLADQSTWIYDDGDTLLTGDTIHEHVFVNLGTMPMSFTTTLDVVSSDGCTSSFSQPINVFPEVNADFSMQEEGCSPLTVDFSNSTTGAATYVWSFGDGLMDINEDPSHVYTNPSLVDSIFPVALMATSIYGCVDSHEDTVLVHPLPIADFELSTNEGCSPLDVVITNNSLIVDSYTWTYGDGEISAIDSASHHHIYTSESTNVVTYDLDLLVETTHGCQAQMSEEITVFPEVLASFETEEALCSGALFTFFNQSQGAMSYQWEFGDGTSSINNNPLHSYSNSSGEDQVYNVTLTAISQYNCTAQMTDSVRIYSSPIANIAIDSTSVCYPLYIEFENSSQYASNYAWDYGDGSNSLNNQAIHSHVFTNSTTNLITYDIEMVAFSENMCADTAYESVQVIPPLIADFESIDNGCHPLEVEFTNESSGALAYDWFFEEGENDTLLNPAHTFNNYGIEDEVYTVVLVASSYFGCSDTITQDITVFPLPDAEFSVDPVLQVYPDATISIFDNSVSGATAIYNWEMGDGTLSSDLYVNTHTYSTWGSYNISLTIDNGHCSDQMIQAIEIQAPPPLADFDGQGDGCAPITIEFDNLSEYGTGYLWNFGDGGVSANEEPVYTYYIPGTYTVSLLVTGPGGSEIVVRDTIINVYPNATAYYTANPEIVNTGDPVFFYNLSNQADEFFWDFGDGITSQDSDPIHIYQETGTFPVSLIANNEYNCPDTFRLQDAVLVDVGGYIEFPNAFTPDALSSTDGTYDPTRLDNNIFYPVFAGVDRYKLQIYNRWGELLYESLDVSRGWDGYYKGTLAQQGVYVWRADVTFTDGKQVIRAGDLTLLR